MKKGDILIALAVVAAIVISVLIFLFYGTEGETVVIKQNNSTVASVPISENKVITLATNTVEIKNGEVRVIWADCKNQLCKKHSAITKKGESIVCLPNKVIVKIED